MQQNLADEIRREAHRLIARHERYASELQKNYVRQARRTTRSIPPPEVLRPDSWTEHPGFNPYLARSHAERIAHAIRRKLRNGSYRPRPPITREIPKSSGGTRIVSSYQVADSAVSRMVYESVLRKNLSLMSARSYAYRQDLTSHDAVLYIRSQFGDQHRLFIAEYDFASFFDNLAHDHILETIDARGFQLTKVERSVIEAFLLSSPSPSAPYNTSLPADRTRGVAPGTSISLLLANIAAADLDSALENLGVGFTRYADDTLIWSSDYSTITTAIDRLHSTAADMGAPLNFGKSEGIRILKGHNDERSELAADTTSIEYLGYEISLDRTRMPGRAIEKIKKRINELAYQNLLQEPLLGTQQMSRFNGGLDRDYVVFVSQVRRYLYGELSETSVRRYLRNDAPLQRFHGVMASFPLVDDPISLRELDEWLVAQSWLAMRKRAALLSLTPSTAPHGMSASDLAQFQFTTSAGKSRSATLPSFRRMAQVLQRASRRHGVGRIGSASGLIY